MLEDIDYSELRLLLRGSEKAMLSGQLTDWQHANTSTFHILCTAILDIHDRLARLEVTTDKPDFNWKGTADGKAAGQ